MCLQLKDEMGVGNMMAREKELLDFIWQKIEEIPNIHVLAENQKERLGVISFYIDDLHFNVGVKLLNDKFGIQTRGGCSCAGTYGHYLLHVLPEVSKEITDLVTIGDMSTKPGWIRMSIHPTHTDEEIQYLMASLKSLALNYKEWMKDYDIDYVNATMTHKRDKEDERLKKKIDGCFTRSFC